MQIADTAAGLTLPLRWCLKGHAHHLMINLKFRGCPNGLRQGHCHGSGQKCCCRMWFMRFSQAEAGWKAPLLLLSSPPRVDHALLLACAVRLALRSSVRATAPKQLRCGNATHGGTRSRPHWLSLGLRQAACRTGHVADVELAAARPCTPQRTASAPVLGVTLLCDLPQPGTLPHTSSCRCERPRRRLRSATARQASLWPLTSKEGAERRRAGRAVRGVAEEVLGHPAQCSTVGSGLRCAGAFRCQAGDRGGGGGGSAGPVSRPLRAQAVYMQAAMQPEAACSLRWSSQTPADVPSTPAVAAHLVLPLSLLLGVWKTVKPSRSSAGAELVTLAPSLMFTTSTDIDTVQQRSPGQHMAGCSAAACAAVGRLPGLAAALAAAVRRLCEHWQRRRRAGWQPSTQASQESAWRAAPGGGWAVVAS